MYTRIHDCRDVFNTVSLPDVCRDTGLGWGKFARRSPKKQGVDELGSNLTTSRQVPSVLLSVTSIHYGLRL